MGLIKTKSKDVVVGTQQYINSTTGEISEFTVVSKEVTDKNFHKIWLTDVLNILDNFGNARLKVLTHLLKQMRAEDNTISGSYRDFAKDMDVSYPVVANTMKELLEANVIKKVRTCTYQFNPELIAKGGYGKRKNLIIQYKYGDEIVTNNNDVKQVIENKANEIYELTQETETKD